MYSHKRSEFQFVTSESLECWQVPDSKVVFSFQKIALYTAILRTSAQQVTVVLVSCWCANHKITLQLTLGLVWLDIRMVSGGGKEHYSWWLFRRIKNQHLDLYVKIKFCQSKAVVYRVYPSFSSDIHSVGAILVVPLCLGGDSCV